MTTPETAEAVRFRLRDYRAADFDRLCQIDAECFPPEIAFGAGEMRQNLRPKGAIAVVAETESAQIAGFLIARRVRGNTGHIITVDVLPDFRRQGLGSRLMLAAEARLRALGVNRLHLETACANRAAQRLFAQLGFVRVRRITRYYPDGSDAWAMERNLNSPSQQAAPAAPQPAGQRS